jgi:hypothetical protein
MGASRKKAVGEVFGGGLPTKSSKNDQTQQAIFSHFCLIRCNAYSGNEISSTPLLVSTLFISINPRSQCSVPETCGVSFGPGGGSPIG